MAEERASLERVAAPVTDQTLHSVHSNEAVSHYGNSYDSYYGKRERLSILREWWQLVYRHKLLIISLVTAIVPLVVIDAYRKKPIYQATALIEVRREGSSMKPNDLFYADAYDNTKAEAIIIRSRPVIEKTVTNLNLDKVPSFLDVNKERSVWEAITALNGAGGEDERKNNQPAVDAVGESKKKVAAADKSSAPGAERAQLAPFINTVSGNIKVEGVRDTRLLKITFTHTDPEIAALVSNGVAKNFMDYNFQNKTQHITDASTWLEESTRKLQARVQEAEQKLANYSREHNIFTTEGKEKLTSDKLVRLHDQATRAETDRMLKQSLYEEVKRGNVDKLPESFADPKTAELRKTYDEMAVAASQLSVKFGAKHPKLVEVRQQMATIQEQINANRSTLEEKLKADYERVLSDESSLKTALNSAKADAVQQNQSAIHYSILQQDLATAKALYTDFLNKTSQASIQRAEQYNNVRLIEAAEAPTGPVGPNRKIAIIMGFLVSLALGVGLAWLIENLNTAVRSVEDITRATPLPVLAVVPALSEESLRIIQTFPTAIKDNSGADQQALSQPVRLASQATLREFSAADEAYRMLRTSVLLSTAGRPPKTIMFTSGQPGDGKTTSVVNAAIAFTQLKAEVLIIDCDMRKPMIHKLANLGEGEGLSTYLSGGGDVMDFIRQTPIPYLSILPSGPVPPNPSELISSEGMKEMLNSLVELYDYILLDSPPLGAVTDPIILSVTVDGVVVVAKSGKSTSETLRHAFQDLSSVRARVLGVILNNHDAHQDGYDKYYSHAYRSNFSDQVKADGATG